MFTAWAGWELFAGEDGPVPPVALAGSLLFLPFLEMLVIGQLGALVAALVMGALLALRRDRIIVAGVLLGLWSLKPQTLLLLTLVLGVHLLATRRWRVLAVTASTVVLLTP